MNKDFQQSWPASKINFIAKKILFAARKNKKRWDKIFSDKNFFMEILLKLLNNHGHPERLILLLKSIIICLSKEFQAIKTEAKYFLTKIFSWKCCWSCSTIVTIQKRGFYGLKISLFGSANDSDNQNRDRKTRRK